MNECTYLTKSNIFFVFEQFQEFDQWAFDKGLVRGILHHLVEEHGPGVGTMGDFGAGLRK